MLVVDGFPKEKVAFLAEGPPPNEEDRVIDDGPVGGC